MKRNIVKGSPVPGIVVLGLVCLFSAGCNLDAAYEKLNGVWDRGDIAVRFDNNKGYFNRIDPGSGWDPVRQSGNIHIGDQKFKDIVYHKSSKTGESWSAKELTYYIGSNTLADWQDCTLTISDDGTTLHVSSSSGTATYIKQ
jgi:phospholipase C